MTSLTEQPAQEPAPPPFSPTWVPDASSSNCLVCAAAFTFSNRRHHCRRCGTLVCQACSSNRLILGEDGTEERVCDVCFFLHLRKSETRESWEGTFRRQATLLSQGSRVSEGGRCIRVYFLDGACRSLYYDATTTAMSLASKITPLPIALFQVEQALSDDAHFELIPPTDKVTDILSRWSLAGWTTAKLVAPLFSSQREATIVPGPNLARRPSCSMGDPRLSIQLSAPAAMPSVTPSDSLAAPGADREWSSRRLSDSQAVQVEVLRLRQSNEELSARCEVLHRQCRRLGGLFPSKETSGPERGEERAQATPRSSTASSSLLMRTSLSNAAEVEDTGPTVEFLDDDSKAADDPPSPSAAASGARLPEPTKKGTSGLSTTTAKGTSQADSGGPKYRVLVQGWLKKQSDFRRVWKHRFCMLCSDGYLRYNGTDGQTFRGAIPLRRVVLLTRSPSGLDLTLVMAGGKRVRLRAHAPGPMFEAIEKALSTARAVRHGPFGGQALEDDDKTEGAYVIEETAGERLTVTSLLQQLQALDDLLTAWDFRLLDIVLDKGRSEAGWFLCAQELVAKVDTLFVKVLELGPDWYARFQAWAVRCLRSSLALPVKDAAMMRAVLKCLESEGLLTHADTTEAVRAVIHSNLKRRKVQSQLSPAIAGVRRSMNEEEGSDAPVQLAWSRCRAIQHVLQAVLENWLPVFPPDMRLAPLLESEVKTVLEQDVLRPFNSNRSLFSVEDLLRLRDWADSLAKLASDKLQSRELALLLDHTSKTFAQESLARMQAQADTWIARTLESLDLRGVVAGDTRRVPTLGWSAELATLLEQQLHAAITRAAASDRSVACSVIVGMLTPLRARLEERLKSLARPDSLDWTCAVVNDYAGFADTLAALSKRFLEQQGDNQMMAVVADAARLQVAAFSQACHEPLKGLVLVVDREIRRCMAALPDAWASNAAGPLADLDAVVQRFMEQSKSKLARTSSREGHLRVLLGAVMDTIVKSYLEVLARAAPRFRQDEDQGFSQRLQRDVKTLSAAFVRFDEALGGGGQQEQQPVLHERVRPILKTVALLEIDPLEVQAFMRRTLLPLFGARAPTLVRCVMQAREASLTAGQLGVIEECVRERVPEDQPQAQIRLDL